MLTYSYTHIHNRETYEIGERRKGRKKERRGTTMHMHDTTRDEKVFMK